MVYCKYSGEQVLSCALGTLVSFGAASADNAIASKALNETNCAEEKTGVKHDLTKEEMDKAIQRAKDYNASDQCKKDTKNIQSIYEKVIGLKKNNKIQITSEIPPGYGLTEGKYPGDFGDVINPKGEVVLGNTAGQYHSWAEIHIYESVFRETDDIQMVVFRHELEHAWHYYSIPTKNFNLRASEAAAYKDSHEYLLNRNNPDALYYFNAYVEFGGWWEKPIYLSDFDKTLTKLNSIK